MLGQPSFNMSMHYICQVEGQAMWSTRPNFRAFCRPSCEMIFFTWNPTKFFARFGISSDLGVTEIFKRINVKNILPYFPRLGRFLPPFRPRPILAFMAPTFRAGQGIQTLHSAPTNASNMNALSLDQNWEVIFSCLKNHWSLQILIHTNPWCQTSPVPQSSDISGS